MNELTKRRKLSDKEKELKKLGKRYQTLLDRLEKFQSEMADTKTKVADTTKELLMGTQERTIKILELQKQAEDLIEELSKSKKFKKKTQKDLMETANRLRGYGNQDMLNDDFDPEEYENAAREAAKNGNGDAFNPFENGEDGEPKFRNFEDLLNRFRPKIDEEERRDIRKVYIRLASKYHPDKAKTEAEAEGLNRIMQRINDANERNDVAELLAIEAEFEDFDPTTLHLNTLEDMVQQQIENTQKKIDLIENQIARIKEEKKHFMRSEFGLVAKDIKKMAKHNVSLEEAAFAEMDDQITHLEALLQDIKASGEKGELIGRLQNLVYPPVQDFFSLLMDQLGDIDFDMFESKGRRR